MTASRLFAAGREGQAGFAPPAAASYAAPTRDWQAPLTDSSMIPDLPPSAPPSAEIAGEVVLDTLLGAARAQLHKTYIVAETGDGITIIDQHAAHERLVMERMKAAMAADGVAVQALLIPEVVDLPGDTFLAFF